MSEHDGNRSQHHGVAFIARSLFVVGLISETIAVHPRIVDPPKEIIVTRIVDYKAIGQCLGRSPYGTAVMRTLAPGVAASTGNVYEFPAAPEHDVPSLQLRAETLPATLETVWEPTDWHTSETMLRYCAAQIIP
jgi:hypothetical protein